MENGEEICSDAILYFSIPYPRWRDLRSRPDYFLAGVSCFALVWKMAIQAPFSIFQTVPQL